LFVVQSLAERAQAWIGLPREAVNAHAEAAAAHEAKLQAEIAVAHGIQRVKEVMARQEQKEAANLKKKLEHVASDLQAVVEGKSSSLPWDNSMCFVRSWA
jgi:CRISPR/Cas system-associated exonuclease Cas4 (RecB family)